MLEAPAFAAKDVLKQPPPPPKIKTILPEWVLQPHLTLQEIPRQFLLLCLYHPL